MADRNVRLERHGELWKEQNKHLSRWAIGLALFASLAMVKVLVPYAGLADRLKQQQDRLAEAQRERAAIDAERTRLEHVDQQIQTAIAFTKEKPWTADRNELVGRLRDLAAAYRRLRNVPLEQVLDAVRTAESMASAEAQPALLAATIQAELQVQRPIGIQQSIQRVVPGPTSTIGRSIAGEAAVLGLEPGRLAGFSSTAQFHQHLDAQLQAQVQKAADEKVQRIVARVDEAIIRPIARLLPADPQPGSPTALHQAIATVRSDLDRWARDHIGNPTWYETIQQKDQQLDELSRSLLTRQAAFGELLGKERLALVKKQEAREERQRQAEARVAEITREQSRLGADMDRLLPDWVRGFVSVEEMLLLYPLAVLGLASVAAVKAGLVRHHYLVVREGHRAAGVGGNDAVLSSLWTLVDRGILGTILTGGVYLGGTVLVWWLFEQGCVLALTWSPGHPVAGWGWVGAWLPAARWAGRLLFTVIIVAVPVVLLRDCAARLRVSRDARPHAAPATGGGQPHCAEVMMSRPTEMFGRCNINVLKSEEHGSQ